MDRPVIQHDSHQQISFTIQPGTLPCCPPDALTASWNPNCRHPEAAAKSGLGGEITGIPRAEQWCWISSKTYGDMAIPPIRTRAYKQSAIRSTL